MKHSIDFIQSSMLTSASYDDETNELTVTFTGGKSYTYVDVPKDIYIALSTAPSAGKLFNSIKRDLVQKMTVVPDPQQDAISALKNWNG